jgi:NADPH-dependent 2,4-dienoyl-CoA reductase/sulfur reductase-like enzyme
MTSRLNLRAAYGKHILHNAMFEKYKLTVPGAGRSLPKAPPARVAGPRDGSWSPGAVCIIGAGTAGLATAIYIHDACVKAGVAPPTIDIYEATERAGGRVYTYQFTDTANPATHNYYDIGAMRIPDIVTMDR